VPRRRRCPSAATVRKQTPGTALDQNIDETLEGIAHRIDLIGEFFQGIQVTLPGGGQPFFPFGAIFFGLATPSEGAALGALFAGGDRFEWLRASASWYLPSGAPPSSGNRTTKVLTLAQPEIKSAAPKITMTNSLRKFTLLL